jgi:preprotein translocase subunit SecY
MIDVLSRPWGYSNLAYCPNIDCPHRKRTGKPAEFMEGITHCSDCGTELVAASQENKSLPQEKSGVSDLTTRILFTLGMIVLWQLISMIPVYGIDHKALSSFFNTREVLGKFGLGGRLSVGALGIMPYLTAYMLVELSALFVPKFKTWRAGGPDGRSKLRRLALFATIIIAFAQGYGVATGIELINDGAFVPHPGIMFRLITILTMTAVVFLLVWISDLITKRGIGHGISILIGSGIVVRFFIRAFGQANRMISEVKLANIGGPPPLFPIVVKVLFVILIITALFTLIAFIERYHKKIHVKLEDGKDAYIPLKLTAAGIIPASLLAPIILFIPVMLLGTFGNKSIQQLAASLVFGGTAYYIVLFPLVIIFYFFLSAQFYNPEKLSAFVSAKNAEMAPHSEADVGSNFDKTLKLFTILGALYLFAIVALYRWLFWPKAAAVVFSGLVLIQIVAISMDIWGELKARKQMGELVKVRECHDIPKAGYLKSILESHGIPCHVQGYYHRALYYIFGPYLEMPVLVPEANQSEAEELAEKYFQ